MAPALLTRGVDPVPARDERPVRAVLVAAALLMATSAAYFWATTAADEDL